MAAVAVTGRLVPIARRTDPATSHEAAAAVTASGVRASQRVQVYALVVMHPGLTSGELAAPSFCFSHYDRPLDRYQIARRLPELREAGLVRQGPARVCRAMGTRQLTWWPMEACRQLELL